MISDLIIILGFIFIAIGSIPFLKNIDRTIIGLTFSVLVIIAHGISLKDAYNAVDLNTIFILFGMMAINSSLQYFGFFNLIEESVAAIAKNRILLLIFTIITSALLSAIFLNDTIAIVFTPFVISLCMTYKYNPIPYLMALATSANIGSALTIIGNPQNIYIGSISNIPFLEFFLTMALPCLISLVVAFLLILLVYKKDFFSKEIDNQDENEDAANHIKVSSIEINKSIAKEIIAKENIYKSIFIVLFLLVGIFLGFNITLVTLSACCILFLISGYKVDEIFSKIDFSLLIFFISLFILTGAVSHSKFFSSILTSVTPYIKSSNLSFGTITLFLSNIISNVPAVVVLSNFIATKKEWFMLALISTFAGNLTLLGSVANLIVCESAKKRGINLSFLEYLKVGVPLTIITSLIGVLYFSFF